MQLGRIPEEEKILLLSTYMRGTAYQFARDAVDNNRSYADFKAEMIETYTPVNYAVNLRVEFNCIKQDKYKSFDEFLERFMFLSKTCNVNEKDTFITFKGALNIRFRNEIEIKDFKEYKEAVLYCKKMEILWKEKSVKGDSVLNYTKVGTNCMHCGKGPHKIEECWIKHPHLRPKKKADSRPATQQQKKTTKSKCHRCGKTGHYVSQCKVKIESVQALLKDPINTVFVTESGDKPIPFTYGYVNNIHCKVGFDTGATSSIISNDMVEKYKFEVDKSEKILFKTVDGTLNDGQGVIHAEVKIGGITIELKLLIINHFSHDILLGDDWFGLTRAGLYPAIDLIRFPSGELKLERRNQLESISNLKIEGPIDDPEYISSLEWDSEKCKIEPEHDLSENQFKIFFKILNNFKHRFAHKISDLEICSVMPFTVTLSDEKPIYIRPYRHSESEKAEIKKQIKEFEEAGMVVRSNSPFSAPVILVPKHDGSKRMCIDYRKINNVTINDPFPLPNLEDLFNKLKGSVVFSSLDCKCGFLQIEMAKDVRKYFAYSTEDVHVEPTVMQFGLKTAPMHFCKIMHSVLGDLPGVICYMDDVTIHTKTVEQHLKLIEDILKRLRDAKIKLNPNKCFWFKKSIKLLGFIIEKNQLRLNPEKIEPITGRKPPRNIKEVQEWLGICGYYRRFIKNFAQRISCITKLLQKEVPFIWSEECQSSFEFLKTTLSEYPVLRMPDFSRKFTLHCDASLYAIGVILCQNDDKDDEYVVSYASKILKKAELNYTITEKECLAVLFGVKKFHTYVYGTDFTVVTDHSALKWLWTIQTPVSRLCRWAIFLQAYSGMNIIHREGQKHGNADAISRPVLESMNIITAFNYMNHDVHDDEALMHFLKYGVHPRNITRALLRKNTKLAAHYKIDNNGVWYRKKADDHKYYKVPPKEDRAELINRSHKIGHPQTDGTFNRLSIDYFWYGMLLMIKNFIKKCSTCQRNETSTVYNHPAKAINVTRIFGCISLDYIFGLEKSKEGYTGILVIIDHVSSWAEAYCIANKEAYQSLKGLIEWTSRYGTPDQILSDRGTKFVNTLIKNFCDSTHIEQVVTAAYNPRANGKAERFNRTFINSLRKHSENNHGDWPNWIPFVLMAYRSQKSSVTNYSPYEIAFGIQMKVFNNESTGQGPTQDELDVRTNELKNLVDNVRGNAKINKTSAQEAQIKAQNNKANIQFESLKPGTKVLIINEGVIPKLDARYKGPFTIKERDQFDNYTIFDATGALVQEKFPLHKFKVIENDDEGEIMEVQKILGHKDENKKRYYLVKWRNEPANKEDWIEESAFNTKDIINKYLKKMNLSENTNPLPKKRGRKPKNINQISIIAILFLIINCILGDIAITGDFKLCSNSYKTMPIDRNAFCDTKSKERSMKQTQFLNMLRNFTKIHKVKGTVRSDKYITNLDVYTKEDNTVMGLAYNCKVVKLTHKFEKTFWTGHEYAPAVTQEIVPLVAAECHQLVWSNKCYGQSLNCTDQTCIHVATVEPKYSRWSTITKTSHNCEIRKKYILAKNSDSNVFSKNCKVSHLYCRHYDSITVWKSSVIKSCAFKRILKNVKLEIVDKSFLAKDRDIVFNFESIETQCKFNLIRTAEGVYLHHGDEQEFFKQTKIPDDHSVDIKKIVQLTLATIDYGRILEKSDLREIFHFQCQIFKSTIELFAQMHNKYAMFTDIRGQSVILYTAFGEIYEPKCKNVSNIVINDKSNYCYVDLPVQIVINKQNITAFMTSSSIIKHNSTRIKCLKNLKRAYRIPNSNQLIIVEGKYRKLYNTNNISLNKVHFINSSIKQTFNHKDILQESFNLKSELDKGSGKYYELEEESISETNQFEILEDIIANFTIESATMIFIISLGVMLLSQLCCFFGLKLIKSLARLCYKIPKAITIRRKTNEKGPTESIPLRPVDHTENALNNIENEEIKNILMK